MEEYKIGRGKWNLTVKQKLEQTFNAPDAKPVSVQNLVPECDPNYVPFGSFTDVKRIIKSGIFYLLLLRDFLAMVRPSRSSMPCQLGRETIRVNITIETDEDDLIGGFRLVNGETVFHRGLSSKALERGAYYIP